MPRGDTRRSRRCSTMTTAPRPRTTDAGVEQKCVCVYRQTPHTYISWGPQSTVTATLFYGESAMPASCAHVVHGRAESRPWTPPPPCAVPCGSHEKIAPKGMTPAARFSSRLRRSVMSSWRSNPRRFPPAGVPT